MVSALSPGDSVEAAQALVQSMPANPVARYSLGVSLDRAKRFREAVAAYRETLRLDPEFAAAYERLGLAAGRTRNFELSRLAFQEAIRRDPSNAELWYNLGVTLGNAGNQADAARVYRVCLFLKADHTDGRFNLDLALSKLKRGRQPAPPELPLDPERFVPLATSSAAMMPKQPASYSSPATPTSATKLPSSLFPAAPSGTAQAFSDDNESPLPVANFIQQFCRPRP